MPKRYYLLFFLFIFGVWNYKFLIINEALAAQKNTFENPKILNNFGMPGSIDTPTAESFPDGQFSVSSIIEICFVSKRRFFFLKLHSK